MSTMLVVWREMLAASRAGRRHWPSVTALAGELGVAVSTAHRSLTYPVEIGAVEISPMEGLVLLDPYRLLLVFAAHRHLQRDIVGHVCLSSPPSEVEAAIYGQPGCVLGGFSAAVAHAGGNRVADYETALVYGAPSFDGLEPAATGEGAEVVLVEGDPWVGRHGPVTTAGSHHPGSSVDDLLARDRPPPGPPPRCLTPRLCSGSSRLILRSAHVESLHVHVRNYVCVRPYPRPHRAEMPWSLLDAAVVSSSSQHLLTWRQPPAEIREKNFRRNP
jgi:hypothetical protein